MGAKLMPLIDLSPVNRELVDSFINAWPWLRHAGVVNGGERLNAYEAICQRMQGMTERPNAHDFLSLEDIRALVNIWQHRDYLEQLGDLPNRLKQATGGERFYADDTAPPFARNFLFELECASLLVDLGLTLTRSTGDLAAVGLGGYRILGECKQPTGGPERQVIAVQTAVKQLQDNRIDDEIGLVFLDLSLAANLRQDHFYTDTDANASAAIRATIHTNKERLHELLAGHLGANDALILARLALPFWNLTTRGWIYQSRWFDLPNRHASANAEAIGNRLLVTMEALFSAK